MSYFQKDYDGNFSYSYYGVGDTILGDYVDPGKIDTYLEDEAFWEAVRRSYKSIDLSGKSKRDMERFNAKRLKTAECMPESVRRIW